MNQIILSKIISFLQSEDGPIDTIKRYTSIAKYIPYTDPKIIESTIYKMKSNIECWALSNSLVYKNYNSNKIYSREDFIYKDNWYTNYEKSDFIDCHTSGSTTGEKFNYRISKKYHDFIEDNNQYGMILNEFGLPKVNLKILILMGKMKGDPEINDNEFGLMHYGATKHAYHGHRSRTSIRHFVKFDDYLENLNAWHKNLIDYIHDKELDVILSSGPIINGIKNYLEKNSIKIKLCKLLSHTSQFPIKEDFYYLKRNNYIDNYCDSMRCWDGGATFFTCKYNTYHLADNLSYCQEIEKKLVCTDYFSLSAPFINYWNGDLCEIINEYKKCDCGRWYRPFKMLQNRPFNLKGTAKLTEIKTKIKALSFKEKIKQINFADSYVNVVTCTELSCEEKYKIKNILSEYEIKYIVY